MSMSFEEGIKMEERCKEAVERILIRVPWASSVEFHGFKGLRRNNDTIDGRLDLLGIDASLYLRGQDKPLKVQVKMGTYNNFIEFGKKRQSFVLGRYHEDIRMEITNEPVAFADLVLLCYEGKEEGTIGAFALIRWPWFIIRYWQSETRCSIQERLNQDEVMQPGSSKIYQVPGLRVSVVREQNFQTKERFGWATHEDLTNMNVIISGDNFCLIQNLEPFKGDE